MNVHEVLLSSNQQNQNLKRSLTFFVWLLLHTRAPMLGKLSVQVWTERCHGRGEPKWARQHLQFLFYWLPPYIHIFKGKQSPIAALSSPYGCGLLVLFLVQLWPNISLSCSLISQGPTGKLLDNTASPNFSLHLPLAHSTRSWRETGFLPAASHSGCKTESRNIKVKCVKQPAFPRAFMESSSGKN